MNMFKKLIHDDPAMGAQDDYRGPGDAFSLAFAGGLIAVVFWACWAVYGALV